jgi:hypothetical protein
VKVQPTSQAEEPRDCEKRSESHRKDIEAILRGLDLDLDGKIGKAWLNVVGLEGSLGFVGIAHRRGLSAPRPIDASIRSLWEDYCSVLDAVLDRFEARFLPVTEVLDQLLASNNPTGRDADTVAEQLPRSLTAAQYFFSRLEDPRWIPMLRKRGFFQTPPDPVLSEDGKTVTITLWPESKYLARMAPKAPHEVLETIREMRETQNSRVLEDLVDALLTMPARMVAPLADRVSTWIAHRYQFLLPRKLGALAKHLVKGSEIDPGFRILREVLMPERKSDAGVHTLPPQAVEARCEPFEYTHILDRHLPGFVEVAGLRSIELLGELLEIAVRNPENELEDGSSLWRPTIDRSDSIHREDVPDQLTTAVLRTALQILQGDASALPALLDAIERHPQRIFRRIALYLLSRVPDPALIRERLTRRSLFADYWSWYEYAVILRDHFQDLTVDQREVILSWIEEGPDPAPYRSAERRGQVPSEEEVQRRLRKWRHKRLAVIREQLPPTWKARYEELRREFGDPQQLQPRGPSVISWHGPTSPLTAEELQGATVEEIVTKLRSWESPGGFEAPTPEGLARLLGEQVAAKPRRFAVKANDFRGLDPTYIRHLLFGLAGALKAKHRFPWRQVLELCRWIVDQSDPEGERSRWWADRDPDWSWTRTQIAQLLTDGLAKGPSSIPVTYRKRVWEILERLVEDRDPTSESESEAGTPTQDPVTQSLNTVRGTAMRAVLQFTLWIAHPGPKRKEGRAFEGRGFDALPDVRRVLELHLDPTHEKSPGVRAVYGQYLPQLVYLDRSWVAGNAALIFPYEGENADALRNAAWEAYLVFQNPVGDTFDLLRGEYARAVERLPSDPLKENGQGERPQERLAEHLMALYWRGRLGLNEGLLPRFFEIAPDPIRKRAITWAGLVLSNEETKQPPADVIRRLRALWDWRLQLAEGFGPERAAELEDFGWWFASGWLGDDWAIRRLLAGLKVLPKTDPDHSVLERLAIAAQKFPLGAILSLERMIAGDERGWVVEVWRENVRAVLRAASPSRSPKVRTALRELVNRLAARGYVDFREFLPRKRTNGKSK